MAAVTEKGSHENRIPDANPEAEADNIGSEPLQDRKANAQTQGQTNDLGSAEAEPRLTMKCLTLMATVGQSAAWNASHLSRGHCDRNSSKTESRTIFA